MHRRHLLAGLSALCALNWTRLAAQPPPHALPEPLNHSPKLTAMTTLVASGPVTSSSDGQIIENMDINSSFRNGVTVVHQNVTVRNCRIRHVGAHGVHAEGVAGLVLQNLEIDHVGASYSGVGPSENRNNINLESCPNTIICLVKASRGSTNVYAVHSEGTRMSFVELHDARGPMPRGQNVQLNASPNSTVEDFSAENSSYSWTEDNISVFRSDRCVLRRGLVSYNNSPTGDGVMIEGSSDCVTEDVDAVQQGNGAFAAVPQGEAGCGGCAFIRCRTRESYNAPRDGRPAPSSNSLSIYTRISPGARKHTIADCQYDALANPRNLIWDLRAVNPGWSFKHRPFAPRIPIRLAFGWS